MQTEKARPRDTAIFDRTYPGTVGEVAAVRADVAEAALGSPVVDDLVLLTSELATNAILHSRSGHPGHKFTVRMSLYAGQYVWAEVADEGGRWGGTRRDADHGRGLSIVAAITGDGNWGIEGDDAARVLWFRLDWGHA
jgi:anti-sigma regulatory factor (Ser/Thr protein kinase)